MSMGRILGFDLPLECLGDLLDSRRLPPDLKLPSLSGGFGSFG